MAPTSDIQAPAASAAKLVRGLDPQNATDEQIRAVANLLYRIMCGEGVISLGESIAVHETTLTARKEGVEIEISNLMNRYHLSAGVKPNHTAQPWDWMNAGRFMEALRTQKGVNSHAEFGVAGKGGDSNLSLAFESKKHLVKALNQFAQRYPWVTTLSDSTNEKSATDLVEALLEALRGQAINLP